MFKFPGKGGWHFVKVKKDISKKLKNIKKFGFGSVKVKARVGKTSWETSLFPEKKNGPYMISIKADVRKKEKIKSGKNVRVHISLT